MILSDVSQQSAARRFADIEHSLESVTLAVVRVGDVGVARRLGVVVPEEHDLGLGCLKALKDMGYKVKPLEAAEQQAA